MLKELPKASNVGQGVGGVNPDGCQSGQHPSDCHLLDGVQAAAQDKPRTDAGLLTSLLSLFLSLSVLLFPVEEQTSCYLVSVLCVNCFCILYIRNVSDHLLTATKTSHYLVPCILPFLCYA